MMLDSIAVSLGLNLDYWLPLIWASFLGMAITLYVLLDGFSLGIGILYPLAKDKEQRDLMMASVAPVWDGNQTWLVGGGMALLTAFPKAFNLLLSVFYLPILFMVIALIFRGLAFEFRFKTQKQKFWDIGFAAGSLVAAFCQGWILGNYVQGFELSHNADQVFFASGSLFSPFALFTGAAVVVAYAMLGSTWLVLKNQGATQQWARTTALKLLPMIILLVVAISLITPWMDSAIYDHWFSLPNFYYLLPIPLLTGLLIVGIFWGLWRKHEWDWLPFWSCIGTYLLVLAGLAISHYPWIVPRHFDIWSIAAPQVSLAFAIVGVLLIVPIILLYTAHAYYVFRGKVSLHDVYH